VDLLCQENIFRDRNIAQYRYSRAWVPREEKRVVDGLQESV
jgi:hypothetical protein